MIDRWRFGRFELRPASRQLLLEGEAVPVGGRAFDLLLALFERRGTPVSKDELLSLVWPRLVVEENNLTVQISALRKLLGPAAIVTVPVRGYQWGLEAAPAEPSPGVAAPELPGLPSIAVLPFTNSSGDAQDEHLCDGLTEEVITELARFRSLFVISRNSSMSYKGVATDVRAVGRELGVRYVLEGSVRRAGERVRVAACLVETQSAMQVWAEQYEGVLRDIFDLQEDMTRAIVASIAPQVEYSERSRPRPRRDNLSAYELALRGWSLLRSPGTGDDGERRERARALAREALAVDPRNELAVRTIAWAQFTQLWLQRGEENERAAREAIALLDGVIAADNGNHHGYHFRALLELLLGQHAAALLDMRRAHELNPNDAVTMSYLGYFEAISGNATEGAALARDALRRSPRDPQRYLLLSQAAVCCFIAGALDEAERHASQGVADAPWFPGPWITLAIARAALGDIPAARKAVEQVRLQAPALLQSRLHGHWNGSDTAYKQRATQLLRRAAGLP